jgi:hypothetical protein
MNAFASAHFTGDDVKASWDTTGGADRRIFSVTTGASKTATAWSNRWAGEWPDLATLMTTHKTGPKDGPCVVPALLREPTRKKEFADRIDVAFLDSDTGLPIGEIEAALVAAGWAAVVSSTHSHMTTKTEVKRSHWDKFFVAHPDATAGDFLRQEKHYLASVFDGAAAVDTGDEIVVIQHKPCPKYRVIVPLARPWLASDYATQAEANAAWKERIEALAAALHLDHDQSCTDTSRLFYMPRRPPNGAIPETASLSGTWCDIFSLPGAEAQSDGLFGRKSRPQDDTGEFVDPDTGECLDLRGWAKSCGKQFEIVKALLARTQSVFVGHVADGCHHHIRCVNDDAHTSIAADRATFIVNASEARNEGFVYRCQHAHCVERDRLFFVRRMLERGWLKVEDLTSPEFLTTHGGTKSKAKAANADDAEWPEPLDFLADADMTGAPELRREHIPEAIAPFVFDTAARLGVDPAAVGLGAIVSLASVISDDWEIQPKQNDYTWTENPRLWGAIVGNPSMLKSPIVSATTKPIDKLEKEARERHENDMRRYKSEMKVWKDAGSDPAAEPKQPLLDRYLVEGATTEAISEILRDDFKATQRAPAGKVIVRQDEMSEWIASFDRYRSGGKGGADRGAYLRLYNGGRYTIDRVGRGAFAIPNWSACVLGGIQPGPIRQIAKDSADDGLLQRFCYCVPAHQARGEDRKPDAAGLARYEALFPALRALTPGKNAFGSNERVVLHAEAHQHRGDILDLVEALASMPDTTDRMKSALGKWPGLWARMTLTFHLIAIADAKARNMIPDVVNVARGAAVMATNYLRDILLPHLLRADAVMFETEQTGHAGWIAGYILSKGENRVAARDIMRHYRPFKAPEQRKEMLEVMASLETMGWLRPEPQADGRAPVAWSINPKVHTGFAERAKREKAQREATKEHIRETLAKHMKRGGKA